MSELWNAPYEELLPQALTNDARIAAAVQVIAAEKRKIAGEINRVLVWPLFEDLPEAVQEVLKYDLDIDDAEWQGEDKAAILRESKLIHQTRGTKYAVEKLVGTIFGGGTVSEWFEYGGQPGYFRVNTSASDGDIENLQKFRAAVTAVKRLSAWLEGMGWTQELNKGTSVLMDEAATTWTITPMPVVSALGVSLLDTGRLDEFVLA